MTQQELLGIVAEKIQSSVEKTTDILEVILIILSEELVQNGAVYIDDFGVFKTQKRSEYVSLNSETGERILMPPAVEIVFESFLNVSIDADLEDAGIAKTDTANTTTYTSTDNTNANNDNNVKRDCSSKVLFFEPDLSLRNSVNSAFVNFEPTVLNEGIELTGIEVISDVKEMLENSTLKDVSGQEDELSSVDSAASETPSDAVYNKEVLSPNVPSDHDSTEGYEVESVIPKQIVIQEDEKAHHTVNGVPSTIDSAPPIKQRFSNSRIWVPIMGGVAITLAALFFFNGTTQNQGK